jgi:hypothetical protein
VTTTLAFDWHIWLTLVIVLGLIVLDFLIGVFTNLSTFSIQKFPNQLVSFVLPYFVPLAALALVQFITPLLNTIGVTDAVGGTFYAFAGTVALKALADIIAKIDSSMPTKTVVVPVAVVPPVVPPA